MGSCKHYVQYSNNKIQYNAIRYNAIRYNQFLSMQFLKKFFFFLKNLEFWKRIGVFNRVIDVVEVI